MVKEVDEVRVGQISNLGCSIYHTVEVAREVTNSSRDMIIAL